jgi:tetratricopeptide (TPR) repeat protein
MNREQLAFLVAGLAFGILIGFGAYHALDETPALDGSTAQAQEPTSPRGPQAMTQTAGPNAEGGAPMVARVNQLKARLQQEPGDVEALTGLANIYYDAAMWEQAANYYERAVQVAPDPNLLTDLGVCYRGLRQFDKALEVFARAFALDPSHWQSLYNTVVVAAYDAGRTDLARQALASMESMTPRPPELDAARLQQLREVVERLARGEGAPS